MSLEKRFNEMLAIERNIADMHQSISEGALKRGGPGDTSGGMEARIAKLEAQMEGVQESLRALAGFPADIATIKADVSHLPSKDYIAEKLDHQMKWTLAIYTLILAIAGIILRVTI